MRAGAVREIGGASALRTVCNLFIKKKLDKRMGLSQGGPEMRPRHDFVRFRCGVHGLDRRKKRDAENKILCIPKPESTHKTFRINRARSIQKIYEFDPLSCSIEVSLIIAAQPRDVCFFCRVAFNKRILILDGFVKSPIRKTRLQYIVVA